MVESRVVQWKRSEQLDQMSAAPLAIRVISGRSPRALDLQVAHLSNMTDANS